MIIPHLMTREFDVQPGTRTQLRCLAAVRNDAEGFNLTLPANIAALGVLVVGPIDARGFSTFTIYLADNGANRLQVLWFPLNPYTPLTAGSISNRVNAVGQTTAAGQLIDLTYTPATQGVLGIGNIEFQGVAGAATQLSALPCMIFQS